MANFSSKGGKILKLEPQFCNAKLAIDPDEVEEGAGFSRGGGNLCFPRSQPLKERKTKVSLEKARK
jgi:hypothetical protein